jgi:TetR/AcrR family transcriptional regulator, cholesterol catabolism regulator
VVDEEAPRRRPGRPRLTQPSPEHLARLDDIVDAAAEVFRAKGYRASTLEDVAEALDLRRASLYHYVRSKSQLLSIICERALSLALQSVDEINRIQDPAERLVALLRMHATLIAREQAMATVFFDEQASLPDDDRARVGDVHRRYFAAFAATVETSIEAGVLPRTDPRLSAHAIVGMVTWVYKWFRPGRDDAEAFADTCVALLLEPRPGRKHDGRAVPRKASRRPGTRPR